MAQRIFHIDKSHVAKVTFTARDGAGRRPLTSWRRIYRVIFLTGPPLKMSLDWPPLNLLELAPPHNFFLVLESYSLGQTLRSFPIVGGASLGL